MDVRVAARVLLLDPSGRILLFEGCDPHAPDRSFWFTVGGGVELGETLVAAAVRELREETGVRLPPGQLVGPVWRRRARFRFESIDYDADEWFFLTSIADTTVDTTGFDEVEVRTVSGHRWWSVDDLRRTSDTVYPASLAELLHVLVADGWDGSLRLVGE